MNVQGLETLDDKSKQEIIKFLDEEQNTLAFKQAVHKHTNMCWYSDTRESK